MTYEDDIEVMLSDMVEATDEFGNLSLAEVILVGKTAIRTRFVDNDVRPRTAWHVPADVEFMWRTDC